MKQISQYIFNLYHYLLNLRDTMEFTINHDHSIEVYQARKKVLVDGIKEGFALGNFIKNNGEKGEELKKKFQDFIDEFYSETSSIIKFNNDSIRVDNTQNIRILEALVEPVEILKDVIFQFMGLAAKNNESEAIVNNIIIWDDRMFRLVFFMLAMTEYEKSFGEFQKVMAESKGQQTPQSKFIGQNELSKLSKLLRDTRMRTRITDNETLDMLDDTIKVIEMTEGRRDRINNKSFKEIFDDINRRLREAVAKVEPTWKQYYDAAYKEMVEIQKNLTAAKNENANA